MGAFVNGSKERSAAARAIIATFKEARNKAVRELAALEKQQSAASERVSKIVDSLVDDFDIPEELPEAEQNRLLLRLKWLEAASAHLDETQTLVGDANYEIDVSDALGDIDKRIKHLVSSVERSAREAKKAGLDL